MVMGTYWGLGDYFMVNGGLTLAWGSTFMATEPTGTKSKTCEARFEAAALIALRSHLLMFGDLFAVLYRVSRDGFMTLLLYRCLSAKLISWTPCWAFHLGISSAHAT